MKIYQKDSSLDNLIEKTLINLKTLVDSKTIFGEEIITPDGTTIIPVSKATIGFVLGGGEYADLSTRRVATSYPMAGGSGGGISLTPVGFLINTNNEIRYIPTCENSSQNIIENVSKISDFILNKFLNKKNKKEEDKNG